MVASYPCSLIDRTNDYGSLGEGSIPFLVRHILGIDVICSIHASEAWCIGSYPVSPTKYGFSSVIERRSSKANVGGSNPSLPT